MRRYQVTFSPDAEQELDELWDFVVRTSGVVKANRFIETIVVDALSLATLPHRGNLQQRLGQDVRMIGAAKNRVTLTFHVGEVEVTILAVRYAGWKH